MFSGLIMKVHAPVLDHNSHHETTLWRKLNLSGRISYCKVLYYLPGLIEYHWCLWSKFSMPLEYVNDDKTHQTTAQILDALQMYPQWKSLGNTVSHHIKQLIIMFSIYQCSGCGFYSVVLNHHGGYSSPHKQTRMTLSTKFGGMATRRN
jgi:hypothetical protein